MDVGLGAEILRDIGNAGTAEPLELIAEGSAQLPQRQWILRRGSDLAKRCVGPLRLGSDAEVARLPLEAHAAERAGSHAAATAGSTRGADDADVGDQIIRRDACSGQIARELAVNLAGELVGQAAAVGCARHGAPVVEAFNAEVVALEARFVGVVLEACLEEVHAGIERLRNDLLAAEEVTHDELHVAAAVDRRNIGDGERARRHGPLRNERVVDEYVDGRGQRRLAVGGDRRERDVARLRREIGRVLHATEAHRPTPCSRHIDRIPHAQRRQALRKIARPGRIQPHRALRAGVVLREQARDENAVGAE